MTALNVIAGLVTIASLFFSLFVYLEGRRKEALEAEKAVTTARRLADMLSIVNAVAQQAALTATLSDRDEVSKKELKHLIVSQLTMLRAAQEGLSQIQAAGKAWKFGTVDHYLDAAESDATSREPAVAGG